jgi:hypothetical protein
VLSIFERRACAALGEHRSTQRKIPRDREDEARLIADIVELARQYGRYGYRKIAELRRRAGARRWLNDGLIRSLSGSINFVAKMAQFPNSVNNRYKMLLVVNDCYPALLSRYAKSSVHHALTDANPEPS